jgi:protein-S-isoprenylcysteine O-methyltransferase Ste14
VVLLLKNLLFTIALPGTVAVYVPLLLTRDRAPASGPYLALAVALFAAGGAIYAWCVWDFARFGRGTPAPIDSPKKLVVRGLYRYARNPMYLGVLTAILGWVALFREPRLLLLALLVSLAFHLFVVLYEEPHLQRQFGSSYDEYRGRVKRWLPRVRPDPGA